MSETIPGAAAGARHGGEAARQRHVRAIVWLALAVVTIGSLPLLAPGAEVDWPGQWLVAVLVAGATAFGAFKSYGELEPRGVPIETLMTPALVAAAVYAAVPVAAWLGLDPALALPIALVVGALFLRTALDAELTFLRIAAVPAARDRRVVEALLIAAAFLLFLGVAATLPGGWALPGIDTPGEPLTDSAVALGVADAAVAFLVGYRLTALASPDGRSIGWASGVYAVLVGIASVIFRWLAIPGLMGPALLVLVLYLWSIVQLRTIAADGAVRRPLEIVALVLAGLIVILYQFVGH